MTESQLYTILSFTLFPQPLFLKPGWKMHQPHLPTPLLPPQSPVTRLPLGDLSEFLMAPSKVSLFTFLSVFAVGLHMFLPGDHYDHSCGFVSSLSEGPSSPPFLLCLVLGRSNKAPPAGQLKPQKFKLAQSGGSSLRSRCGLGCSC